MWAYHIMRYLRINRLEAKITFVEDLRKEDVFKALEYSSNLDIESWDGYLLSLAESLGTIIIFSIDGRLRKSRRLVPCY